MELDQLLAFIMGLGPVRFPGPAMIEPSDLVAVIVIPSLCLMVGWLAWMLTRTNHLKVRARIELNQRLLEKIGSTQDVAHLLQTEEGRQLLEALAIERTTSLEQILGTVQKGVILTTVGLGAISLRLFFPTGFALFIILGVFVGVVGLGFIVSSAVAYKLSKSWDLLEPRNAQRERPDASLFR